MKLFFTITLSLVCASAIYADKGEGVPTPVKRPSHEDISKKQKEQATQVPVLAPSKEKTILPSEKRSLIAKSTLLSSDSFWTLLPRGSVIHVPKHLKGKVTRKPYGALVDWKTFLRKNHGWIHVHEVTMTQAQGKGSINPKIIEAYQSMGKIVVATCSGGPISVAPTSLVTKKEK